MAKTAIQMRVWMVFMLMKLGKIKKFQYLIGDTNNLF